MQLFLGVIAKAKIVRSLTNKTCDNGLPFQRKISNVGTSSKPNTNLPTADFAAKVANLTATFFSHLNFLFSDK